MRRLTPIRKTMLLVLLAALVVTAMPPVWARVDWGLGRRFPEFYAIQLLWRAARR